MPLANPNKAYVLMALSLDFAPVEKVLAGTDLTIESIAGEETIAISDGIIIVKNLNQHSHTPNWAALLGNHLGITSHGPVGFAAISAPTVGKALTTFLEWFQIRAFSYISRVIEHPTMVEIEIEDTTGSLEYQEFFFEAFMRAFEVLIGVLAGNRARENTELHLKTQAINRRHLMVKSYDSSLHFGSPKNSFLIPRSVWKMPSPLYDKHSHDFNLRKCRQLMEEMSDAGRIDFAVRNLIREKIEANLINADAETALPTLGDVCNTLYVSERTLIRRLNDHRTSYKEIIEQERKYYADTLLKDAVYTIYDVADILGYSEQANFSRAFKKWFDQSPTQHRRVKRISR